MRQTETARRDERHPAAGRPAEAAESEAPAVGPAEWSRCAEEISVPGQAFRIDGGGKEEPGRATGAPARLWPNLNRAFAAYRRAPGPDALEAVALAGRPLALHFAHTYASDCPLEDGVQSALLGLMEAIPRFDGRVQFSTWASWCMISEIRHYARRERAFRGQLSCPPDGGDAVPELFDEAAAALSPELPVEERVALRQALSQLSASERRVIDALFYRGLTQRQTADELGLTQRKVSRVKAGAVQKLKALLDAPNFRLVKEKASFRLIAIRDNQAK